MIRRTAGAKSKKRDDTIPMHRQAWAMAGYFVDGLGEALEATIAYVDSRGGDCQAVLSWTALVPKPRAHLIRYHGVLAPNSRLRAQVTPGRRGKRARRGPAEPRGVAAGASARRAPMTWAQRLKRVFCIDIKTCLRCGARLRVIASIEEPALIKRILDYLGRGAEQGSLVVAAS